MQEGEVGLLGGLINQAGRQDRHRHSRPLQHSLLGKLFSGNSVDHNRDELMIVAHPAHSSGGPKSPRKISRPIAVGNATMIQLHHAPKPARTPTRRAGRRAGAARRRSRHPSRLAQRRDRSSRQLPSPRRVGSARATGRADASGDGSGFAAGHRHSAHWRSHAATAAAGGADPAEPARTRALPPAQRG